MKIHEYQAKEIFRRFDVPTPEGAACFSADEARTAAQKIGGDAWAVKAQIHAGGRGKGGGVKIAKSADEVARHAGEILGMTLITPQTGAQGRIVKRLLVEAGANIAGEFYLGMVVDRARQRAVLMASSEGGMEIEEVAKRAPEKIRKMWIDPQSGVDMQAAKKIAAEIGLDESLHSDAAALMQKIYRVFTETDASLIEINPLILTADNRLLALDGKMNFDDNALFRRPEIAALRDEDEEDPAEMEASQFGLSYISLDGDIGCMVNGAGLAMATMDIIKLCGGTPANFLDVGGGADAKQVTAAFKLMLANPKIRAILVNIFGGIMRCDVIAEGIVAAAHEIKLSVPLIVRLEGTNVEEGRKILAESGLPIISATTMADAAQKAAAAAAEK
jgi:succinyl-CoA synthetase beta subunit